jgi:4-hydroxybenzoyl-CoA reductase subunit beta
MMRLPKFKYLRPRSLAEACRMLADAGPTAMVVAGGTDLYPNMKRRHQMPRTVVALRHLKELKGVDGTRVAAGELLSDLERNARLREEQPALWTAVWSISTPVLRNMGTIGGNVCLDTRCTYYNQTFEWRKAIDFCMKCDGKTCWVAPSSDRCLAINSSDTAPVLCAIGARFRLRSVDGEREVPADEFYGDDGINYLKRRPNEILTDVLLPKPNGWKSTYLKLRRRGAFDFPVLGVAARLDFDGPRVREARIYLNAVWMRPLRVVEAQKAVVGGPLDDDSLARAGDAAFAAAKPMDNADFHLHWRKEMARVYVKKALLGLKPR